MSSLDYGLRAARQQSIIEVRTLHKLGTILTSARVHTTEEAAT